MGQTAKQKRYLRRQAIRIAVKAVLESSAAESDRMPGTDARNARSSGPDRSQVTARLAMPPAKIFRFLPTAEYADAFCEGQLRISTLGACRGYEDPKKGDGEEAQHTYRNTHADHNKMSPEPFRFLTKRLGMDISNSTNVVVSNATNIVTLPDAYVLCCTEYFAPERLSDTFGRCCVEISDSEAFFRLLTERLKRQTKLVDARLAMVTYDSSLFVDFDPEIAPLGFIKRPDPYAEQREVRMLWRVADASPLAPFNLDAPEVASLCRRIV